MTTVRGTIRSTNTITADGHADDQSTARANAIAGLERTGYNVVQTNTVSSTAAGRITVLPLPGRPRSSHTKRPGRTTAPLGRRTCSRFPTGGSAWASPSTPDEGRSQQLLERSRSGPSATVRDTSHSVPSAGGQIFARTPAHAESNRNIRISCGHERATSNALSRSS